LPVAYAVAALVGRGTRGGVGGDRSFGGGEGERPVSRETAAGGGGGRWRGLDAKRLAGSLLPAVLAGSVLFAFERWLAATSGLPKLYQHAEVQIARFFSQGGVQILVSPLFVLGVLGVYLGLFLLPVSIATFASPAAGRRRWLAAWLGTAAIVTAVLWKRDTLMPLTGNTLWESGVGPPTFRDVFLKLFPCFPVLPSLFLVALTFSLISG